MENYSRVIPRDFFNEAKLLKCMGLLALNILDGKQPENTVISIADNDEPFNVVLLDDGHLTVINYPVKINGIEVIFKSTYNSKSNYPLLAEYQNCEYVVFDEHGQWDSEFLEFCSATFSHLVPHNCEC